MPDTNPSRLRRSGATDDDVDQDVGVARERGPAGGTGHDLPPIRSTLADLVDDARIAAEAEVDVLKARAAVAISGSKQFARWAFFAGLFVTLAVLVIVIGTLLGLASVIGFPLATLVVAGVLLIGAVITGLVARRAAGDVGFAVRGDLSDQGYGND